MYNTLILPPTPPTPSMQNEEPTNEPRENYLPPNQPHTIEEVRWKQMDIIMKLHDSGVPLMQEDSNGDTASDRACRRLEDPFIEGAMLLGVYIAVRDNIIMNCLLIIGWIEVALYC